MDLVERTDNPNRHPWELSRADMLLRLLDANGGRASFADIGSGDLYFASRLRRITSGRVYAVDVNYDRPRVENGVDVCTDLQQVPSNAADWAILMDVLEHVQDDVELLRATHRILTAEGRVLITVPAHLSLWSEHDVFLGHVRRYGLRQLKRVIDRSGFEPLESFYFYALPCAMRFLTVQLERLGLRASRPGAVARWRFPPDHIVTGAVRAALNADFRLSRIAGTGALAGLGLSIAAVCRPKSS